VRLSHSEMPHSYDEEPDRYTSNERDRFPITADRKSRRQQGSHVRFGGVSCGTALDMTDAVMLLQYSNRKKQLDARYMRRLVVVARVPHSRSICRYRRKEACIQEKYTATNLAGRNTIRTAEAFSMRLGCSN